MDLLSYFLCVMASACRAPGAQNPPTGQMRLPPILDEPDEKSNHLESAFQNDVMIAPAMNATRKSYRPGRFFGTDLTVDVLLLVDYAVYKLMAKNFQDVPESQRKDQVLQFMKEYYGLTFNAIAQRYDQVNFPLNGKDGKIRLRLNGLLIATSKEEDTFSEPKTFKLNEWSRQNSLDTSEILMHLAKWFQKQQDSGKYRNIDHVMLITGNNLSMKGPDPETGKIVRRSVAVGVSYKGKVCGELTVSASQEDMQFEVVGTAAHELGHNLGADHDGEGEGASCDASKSFIMNGGVTLGDDKTFQNQYKFSQCSLNSMAKVMKQLNAKGENCLADTGPQDPELKKLVDVVPGFKYDLHQQCKIFTKDKDSYFCRSNANEELGNVCRKPKCYRSKHRFCGDFLGHNHVLPGTPCGKDKWCMNGACVKASVPIPTTENGCVMRDSPKCDTYTARECRLWPKVCCNKCKVLLKK